MVKITENFWDTFDAKKWSATTLIYIKQKSYYRYPPPNQHFIYMMLSLTLITFSFMFFAVHMRWCWLDIGEFPKYHKIGFWCGETIAFFGGLALLPYWFKLDKIARKNWKEMDNIRKIIDNELKLR